MRLYLDDFRDHPEGWERARNAREAKEILSSGLVRFASLDHDLDYGNWNWDEFDNYVEPENGHDVVKFMVENNIWPEDGVRIHTDNPSGRHNMMELIEHYGPYENKDYGDGRGTEGIAVIYTP